MNAKGYIPDNVQLVCWCYNVAKQTWTDEDVLKLAKGLLEKENYKLVRDA